MKKIALLLALLLALPLAAQAEEYEYDDTSVYEMRDENGRTLMRRAGRLWEGDEYIATDNSLYRVESVDDATRVAVARLVGQEPQDAGGAVEALALAGEKEKADKTKKIGMYCTHSDESYEPSDGDSSLHKNAGIYDVSEALKAQLEKRGVTVELDETSHLPHDAKAYSRSRRTAEELLKNGPDALLDIHRDGIPDESEYETTVNGESTSMVRLLVGRSNPNADANRAFAKEIKAVADEKYPGLIKDIFIGKGNYNQELYPQSILLEFGTHTLDKERAIRATSFMADVLDDVLYGGSARAAGSSEGRQERSAAGGKGVLWVLLGALALTGLYALISTGTFGRAVEKIKRGASEMTGGVVGKKPKR